LARYCYGPSPVRDPHLIPLIKLAIRSVAPVPPHLSPRSRENTHKPTPPFRPACGTVRRAFTRYHARLPRSLQSTRIYRHPKPPPCPEQVEMRSELSALDFFSPPPSVRFWSRSVVSCLDFDVLLLTSCFCKFSIGVQPPSLFSIPPLPKGAIFELSERLFLLLSLLPS